MWTGFPTRQCYSPISGLEEFPLLFGHIRAMVFIVIFCIGKLDRSSNKDGADYEQSRP
jgi:hypothetical protein